MTPNSFDRVNRAAAFAIWAAVSVLLCIRAYSLSFTHDEGLTYLHAVRPGLARLLAFGYQDANNHLLNSLATWVSSLAFGTSEWALRLPNVLAFAAFSFFGFRIAARRLRPALVIPGLLLLVCNPFQLDFFALSRGYGIALAFTLASLDYGLSSLESDDRRPPATRRRDAAKAAWCAAAATLANFAWLNFYLGGVVVLGSLWFIRARRESPDRSFLRDWLVPQLPPAVLLAAIATPVLYILQSKQGLYLGGDTGVWHDSIGSLIDATLYAQSYADAAAAPVAVAIAAIAFGAAIVAATGLRGAHAGSSREGAVVMVGILAVCSMSIASQHALLGTKFLTGRTALFLLPLFALAVVFAIDAIAERARVRGAAILAAGALAGLAAIHTAAAVDTSKTLTWAYDADTKTMLHDLRTVVGERPAGARRQSLASQWLHQPSINYYRERLALDWLEPMNRRGFEGEHDFYFFRRDANDPRLDRLRLLVVREYPRSGHLLARDTPGRE